jgi:stearoyl-CoA 9-desaturase NADPH oxidoreductase
MSAANLATVFRSTWLRPFNDPAFINSAARRINPLHQTTEIGARVVQVIDETPNCKTFVLQTNTRWPGKRWPGHQAGQHTSVTLTLDGRKLSRTFTISSAPSKDGRVSITVKHTNANNRRISVSNGMFGQLKTGAILSLSPPSGDFTLPISASKKLLMLSAGSGITPMMAMLRSLDLSTSPTIEFIHVCRNESDFIFAIELRNLAARHPALHLTLHYSGVSGRFDPVKLAPQLPDLAQHVLYVCGPNAFADDTERALRAAGITQRIHRESFGGFAATDSDALENHALHLNNTKQSFTVSSQSNLLSAMESAGLNPVFGCRIGICRTCQCVKRSGVVKNLRTGEISDAPNELIALCVSAARSPIELTI